jgi:hypothetical protein
MVDQRNRRRPKDAEARDGNQYDRNGLAMKKTRCAVKQILKSVVREIRMLRSVGVGAPKWWPLLPGAWRRLGNRELPCLLDKCIVV